MQAVAKSVDDLKRPVTAEEFREIVAREAFCITKCRERGRRGEDWWNARKQLAIELETYRLTEGQIRERAYQLYEQRKNTDAMDDWLEAEERVKYSYRLVEAA